MCVRWSGGGSDACGVAPGVAPAATLGAASLSTNLPAQSKNVQHSNTHVMYINFCQQRSNLLFGHYRTLTFLCGKYYINNNKDLALCNSEVSGTKYNI